VPVATAAGLAVVIGAAALWHRHSLLPRRFGVVAEGRLYRCGEITPRQLAYVARRYGLRTVLSLLDPAAPESVAERRAAEELGLRWINVRLPGNGASTPEQRQRIKAVLLAPDAGPTLVHCAAGVNRTGLAVGLYRIHSQGWTVAEVLAEMRAYGFEDLARHQDLREALQAEAVLAEAGSQPASQQTQP